MDVEYSKSMGLVSINCYMFLIWTKITQADEVEWQANLRKSTENQVQQRLYSWSCLSFAEYYQLFTALTDPLNKDNVLG